MNFAISLFVLLFSGLILAQDDGNTTELQTQPCGNVDMCEILKEFGAMTEKLRNVETRLQNSETALKDCQTRLTDSETKLKNTESRLTDTEARLTDTETKLKDSQNRILKLEEKVRTRVMFSAVTGGGNKAIGPFNTDTTLIYRVVKTNIGNAYSPSTGIFNAPFAGFYYFTIFYHAGGHEPLVLLLYKNHEIVVMTSDHSVSYDSADNGGNAVFLQLQKGDQVYVRLAKNSHVWGSDYHTTFSGFLVSQM
ncbi:caprin-2-like [Plectropomus leopardus]|uniref:caprin-2-like n=1 Tax=Plectropomus leopardus TaxID=160734 RepID=UPI001C4DAAF2|nr:caprin-2-like [Plectropomus leopardus]